MSVTDQAVAALVQQFKGQLDILCEAQERVRYFKEQDSTDPYYECDLFNAEQKRDQIRRNIVENFKSICTEALTKGR